MNSYAKHIKLNSDIPIFSTSLHETYVFMTHPDEPQTRRHKVENNKMEIRWNVVF